MQERRWHGMGYDSVGCLSGKVRSHGVVDDFLDEGKIRSIAHFMVNNGND